VNSEYFVSKLNEGIVMIIIMNEFNLEENNLEWLEWF